MRQTFESISSITELPAGRIIQFNEAETAKLLQIFNCAKLARLPDGPKPGLLHVCKFWPAAIENPSAGALYEAYREQRTENERDDEKHFSMSMRKFGWGLATEYVGAIRRGKVSEEFVRTDNFRRLLSAFDCAVKQEILARGGVAQSMPPLQLALMLQGLG